MDDSYAVPLRVGRAGEEDLLTVLKNATSIRLMDPSENLYQGRFSGSILTRERMDLACLEAKVDIVQNLNRSEALADIAKLDDGGHAQLLF